MKKMEMERGNRGGEKEKWKKTKVTKETENIIAVLITLPVYLIT
jgi:hypothetical protein